MTKGVGAETRRAEAAGSEPPVRRRRWPVRVAYRLGRPFVAAVATGTADPPGPPPAWRYPAALQHLRHALPLPIRRIDAVVLAEIVTVFFIFAATNIALVTTNARAGTPVDDGELFILAAATASLPLLLRERWPLAAWRVAFLGAFFTLLVAQQVHPYQETPEPAYPLGVIVMYLAVLYAVGLRCERHVAVGVWIYSGVGILFFWNGAPVLLGLVMTAAALLFGRNVRTRRLAQQREAEQAFRTEVERDAREVLAERSRIARELHDVVAHHMSVIAIQAEAAPIKAPDDPAALKRELAEIRVTALAALTELRRVLGVLRQEDESPTTAPQPDLERVEELLATSRTAGQEVTLTTVGEPVPLPPGVGLAGYRILQESLSNALRHAPGAPVQVAIEYLDRELRLRVENEPPRRPASIARGGHGVTGMRERVVSVGGTLSIGPTQGGGFVVTARLPIEAGEGP